MSMGTTDGTMADAMQSMIHVRTWTATEFGLRLLMWIAMMVAMMVPTAVPMTLVYGAVARKAACVGNPVAPTLVFVAGYLAMWGLFSVAATAAQRSLDQLALLSPTMASASPVLGSSLLIAAGAYELSPYKHACLAHCRALHTSFRNTGAAESPAPFAWAWHSEHTVSDAAGFLWGYCSSAG